MDFDSGRGCGTVLQRLDCPLCPHCLLAPTLSIKKKEEEINVIGRKALFRKPGIRM